MSERPWMPFYVNDFQIDTTGLTADERGVYITMVCLAWRSGDGSVSGDMEELKTVLQNIIADFHGLTFNRVVPKLLDRYFEKRAGGRFYQPGVEKELRIARELSEKQSRNAKERWSQDRKNNCLADATAMPSHSHSHSHKERGGQLRVKKEEADRIFVEFGTPEWDERSKHPPPGKSRWPHQDFHFDDGVKHGWFFPKAVQPRNCG